MSALSDDQLFSAFAPGRQLQESDAVVQRALADDAPKSHRRRWALLAALLVLVPASAAAVHAIQAEPGSAGDAFTSYLDDVNPESWPGKPFEGAAPIPPGQGVPATMLIDEYTDPRVLARDGNLGLYVGRTPDGDGIGFAWNGIGLGMNRSDLYEIAHEKVASLGPGPAIHGLTPLYGVSDDQVTDVRMTYVHGPPSPTVEADGGFILMVDSTRNPQTIEGLDAQGEVIGQAAAGGWWADEARDVQREQRQRR